MSVLYPSSASSHTDCDLYDTFNRADTVSGVGVAPSGQTYTIIPDYGSARISSGRMIGVTLDSQAYYVRAQLTGNVSRNGARVRFTGSSDLSVIGVMLVTSTDAFLDKFLHFVFSRQKTTVQYSLNGAAPEDLILLGTVTNTAAVNDEFDIEVFIVGDIVTVTHNGVVGTFTNANISDCTGPYVIWEGGRATVEGTPSECEFFEIWADAA